MELLEVLDRWFVVRRRAPRTFQNYRFALRRMARFGLVRVEDVTPQLLGAWILDRSRTIAAVTTKAELAALFASLSFLERSGEYSLDTLRRLRRLTPELKKPKRLSAVHLDRQALERLCDSARRERSWRRDGAGFPPAFMIRVAALTGFRATELARTRWEDYDLGARPCVRVRLVPELGQAGRIKTGEERVVPICAELAELLRQRAGAGYLFRHGSKARVNAHASVKTLYREVVYARRSADLDHVTFHILRHTRASWWAQAGVPLVKIAAWLGNTLEVVERYYAALRDGYDPDCEKMPAA